MTVLGDAIARSDALLEKRGSFDAIIVGAGASGGYAAMLLTQAGLNVLVLDAGWRRPVLKAPLSRTVSHLVRMVANPKLYDILPWGLLNAGGKALAAAGSIRQPLQSKFYAWPLAPEAFVDDREAPYALGEGSAYNWFRVRQIGGRMTVPGHGRQYFRMSADAFSEMGDLSPWYDQVEKLLQLNGGPLDSSLQPASTLANSDPLHPCEQLLVDRITQRWPEAEPMIGQWAPHVDTMDRAAATGRLTCRTGAVVRDVDASRPWKVVSWHDRATGKELKAASPMVFLGASALETARILLMSKAPGGGPVGAESGLVGRGLVDHVLVRGDGIGGKLEGGVHLPPAGRCVFLPCFDRREGGGAERPFGLQVYQSSWGADKSHFTVVSFGEMATDAENRVELDPTRKDAFGIPQLRVHFRHGAADRASARLQSEAIRDLAETAGAKLHRLDVEPDVGGTAMHEVGTARMGRSPETSVVNQASECWDAPGLHVIDGAAMPEQGFQNPTLTIMALTARACAHAIGERMAGNSSQAEIAREFAK